MDADRPITSADKDRLGFGTLANHLARVITSRSSSDGLVIGIEGKWGSGKSTLINLTIEKLKRQTPLSPEIVEFSPWLIGARDDLLHHLLNELATSASRIDPLEPTTNEAQKCGFGFWGLTAKRDAHRRLRRNEKLKKRLETKLRSFAAVAGGLSNALHAANVVVPGAGSAGSAIGYTRDLANSLLQGGSLAKRKQEIVSALNLLSKKIVVFVDDIDRLDPRETYEVLRLIRAVADFPNVIYVLSFDREVVSKSIENAVSISDGFSYLDKILQVFVRIPKPEAFDLRRWFQAEVQALFPQGGSGSEAEGVGRGNRIAEIIDVLGGRYLHTPRDVIRAINALRMHVVPMQNDVDLADAIWLQLIRLGNPDLHAWIEEYLTETSAMYRGASGSDDYARKMGTRLNDIIAESKLDAVSVRMELASVLPGLGSANFYGEEQDKDRVFVALALPEFGRFIADRRLGSPDHYRFYFAFSHPAGSLRDAEVRAFLELAERSPDEAIHRFDELCSQERPQGGVMAEVLVERIVAIADKLPLQAVAGVFAAFSNSMDRVARRASDGPLGDARGWRLAALVTQTLLRRVTDPGYRATCIGTLFAGPALGWQTRLLRDEIFAHGHYGPSSEPESERLLSPEEFKRVLELMLRRYREASPEIVLGVPNPMSLLYGWLQGAKSEEPRNWISSLTQTDEGLLNFLSRVRGTGVDNKGVHKLLKKADLANFLDYAAARSRVQKIVESPSAPAEQRRLASELLAAMDEGERWPHLSA